MQGMNREFDDGAEDAFDTGDLFMVSMHAPLHRAISYQALISHVDHVPIIVIDPAGDSAIFVLVGISMNVVTKSNENAAQLPRTNETFHHHLFWNVLPKDVHKSAFFDSEKWDLSK